MSIAPKRICPACRRRTAKQGELCAECSAKNVSKAYDSKRGSSSARGYDRDWQRIRARKLDSDPLCQCDRCVAMGRDRAANTVHHIKPVDIYPHLRLSYDNLVSMSSACHNVEHGRSVVH